jgi:hypothetical protein
VASARVAREIVRSAWRARAVCRWKALAEIDETDLSESGRRMRREILRERRELERAKAVDRGRNPASVVVSRLPPA